MDRKLEMIERYRKENIFDYPRFLIFRDIVMIILLVILIIFYALVIQKVCYDDGFLVGYSGYIIIGLFITSLILYVLLYNLKRVWLYVTDIANWTSLIDCEMQKLNRNYQKTTEYCKDLNRLYVYILSMSQTNTRILFKKCVCESEDVFDSFVRVLNLDIKEFVDDQETMTVINSYNIYTIGDAVFLYNDLEWPNDNLKARLCSLHPILDKYLDSGDFLKNILISIPYRKNE